MIWLEPGKGTVGGTRAVTACTPRAEAAGWRLPVAHNERTVTYLLSRAGHNDYLALAAKVATATPG